MQTMTKEATLRGLLRENSRLAPVYQLELENLGMFMALNRTVFRDCYYALKTGQTHYHYAGSFGMTVDLQCDYTTATSQISGFGDDFSLELSDLMYVFGIIDSVYAEILPIGSVVALDQRFAQNLPVPIADDEQPPLFAIVSRKLVLEDASDYVVDYLVVPLPLGYVPEQAPLVMTNMMIADVIHRGYTDANEDDYCQRWLHAGQLGGLKQSTAFMPAEVFAACLQKQSEET